MSYADNLKAQEEEARKAGHAGGGDWFKFVEGDNRFRVLSEPVTIYEDFNNGICYTDCGFEGSPKDMTYILDSTGKIKLAKLPHTVAMALANYEGDEDYAFTGFPMDYDIKVNAKGAGTKEVKYTVTPSPKRAIVGSEVVEELAKKKPMHEVVTAMKEKNKAKHVADGSFEKRNAYKKEAGERIAAALEAGETIEYPADEVNPEDIPF